MRARHGRTHLQVEDLYSPGKFPVVALVGARQTGKTTPSPPCLPGHCGALCTASTWKIPGRWPGWRRAESLAGRVAVHEVSGFDLREAGAEQVEILWRRGGFPRAFLASNDAAWYCTKAKDWGV